MVGLQVIRVCHLHDATFACKMSNHDENKINLFGIGEATVLIRVWYVTNISLSRFFRFPTPLHGD